MVEDLYIEHEYSKLVGRMKPSRTHVVAAVHSIHRGEESLPIQGICTRYRDRPAGARWGQNSRGVAYSAEYFRGVARAIGTFSRKHWAVRCRATILRSPYRLFRLEERPAVLQPVVNVMQPVSHSSCSLAF